MRAPMGDGAGHQGPTNLHGYTYLLDIHTYVPVSGPMSGGAGHHGPTNLPDFKSKAERWSGQTMAPFSTVPW